METIRAENFERVLHGKEVTVLEISNANGTKAVLTNYGARVLQLYYTGVNVVQSFSTLDNYFNPKKAFHSAVVGRYANRIKEGRFTVDGRQYSLAVNNGANHLHGGPGGFHNQVWAFEAITANSATLRYFSKDGEEGYPGNLEVTVTYTIPDNDELIIRYEAKTDAATPFNITNHAYFNLNGGGTITNHLLQFNADRFTAVDETLIPKALLPVENTAFDFRQPKPIGRDINSEEEQIKTGGGYDHNFVLNKGGDKLTFAAKAVGDKTGIVMETFTEEPGIQLFSGNFAFDDDPESFRTSFCLETQHFPDSPNQPDFPSTILEPGRPFTSQTIYKFSR
jgi:aldose 1-epimerase